MDEQKRTREEYAVLHLYGFHEVKGLEGMWQRGRAGVDVPVDPKVFSTEEALKIIRDEQEERDDD
jgi:hypothetical protein